MSTTSDQDNLFGELVVVSSNGGQDGPSATETSTASVSSPSLAVAPTTTGSPSPVMITSDPTPQGSSVGGDGKAVGNGNGNGSAPSAVATRPDLNRLYSAAKADTEALVAPLRTQVTQLASQVGTMRAEGRDTRRDVLQAVAKVADAISSLDERMARIEAMLVPDSDQHQSSGSNNGSGSTTTANGNNGASVTAVPPQSREPAVATATPFFAPSAPQSQAQNQVAFAQPVNNAYPPAQQQVQQQQVQQQQQQQQSATPMPAPAVVNSNVNQQGQVQPHHAVAVPAPISQVTGTVRPAPPAATAPPASPSLNTSNSNASNGNPNGSQAPVQVAFDRKLISDAVGLGFSEESVLAALHTLYAAGRPCNDINLVIDTINA